MKREHEKDSGIVCAPVEPYRFDPVARKALTEPDEEDDKTAHCTINNCKLGKCVQW